MSQLFFRRHYETIARVLGVAHHHARSTIAQQTIDLITRMFVRIFRADSRAFRENLFKQSVLRAAGDLDVEIADPPKVRHAGRRIDP